MAGGSDNPGMGRTVLVLFLGQIISLSIAMTNFSVSLIAKQGVDAPLTISLLSYVTLASVYGAVMLYRRRKLSVSWYWYIFLGLADVQGNYLVIKSYNYTTITSVTVLLCWSIVWAIVLTWLVLGTQYSLLQFIGAAICVGGLGVVLLADSKANIRGGKSPLFGDMLVIVGTVFLTMGNVGLEYCVKNRDRVEAMTMLGVFGTLISVLGIIVFEKETVESIPWTPHLGLLYIGVLIPGFVFYTVGPLVLKMSGATLFNMSVLTSNLWAVLIKIFIYKEQVKWLLYPAYTLVFIGIVIYSTTQKIPRRSEAVEDGSTGLLDEEGGNGNLLE
ncbi:uncharacterized protein LOC127251984 [Andrographis paniculata]|uniref:uncharacterized protein LOC127251984 n=1 Tax=Andrographis paniculata TaxID=175694 RepID=UPI0021E8E23A|nr:uncharacterized protein LOC127251984 [Andrographis paniculata]